MTTKDEQLRVKHIKTNRFVDVFCDFDREPWPCTTICLLDHIVELEAMLETAEDKARHYKAAARDNLVALKAAEARATLARPTTDNTGRVQS